MVVAYGCGKGRIHRNVQQPYEPPEQPTSKTCAKCGEEKPVSEFPFSKRDGLGNCCRECDNARKRESKARKRGDR